MIEVWGLWFVLKGGNLTVEQLYSWYPNQVTCEAIKEEKNKRFDTVVGSCRRSLRKESSAEKFLKKIEAEEKARTLTYGPKDCRQEEACREP